jgi:hypothetical protein
MVRPWKAGLVAQALGKKTPFRAARSIASSSSARGAAAAGTKSSTDERGYGDSSAGTATPLHERRRGSGGAPSAAAWLLPLWQSAMGRDVAAVQSM